MMEQNKNISSVKKEDIKLTIHERDQLFLSHAKSKKYIFDVEKGIIYSRDGVVIGTHGKKSHMHYFMVKRQFHAITRSRAIWLYVNGFVPDGVSPSHISEDRFDDSISNLELKNLSQRSKKALLKKGVIARRRKTCSKLTLDDVNFARVLVKKGNHTYNEILTLVEKRINQSISKTSLIFACQGRTYSDASEPPVQHKQKVIKVLKRKSFIVVKKTEPIQKDLSETQRQREASIKIVKSLLRNNPNISNDGITIFLGMRKLEPIGVKKLKHIRKEIKLEIDKI